MAVYSTYDQIGKAESVEDIIYDISPTDTPFLSSVKNEKVSARTFSWIEDALTAAAENKEVEGFTATDETLTTPTERTNQCQIMSKTINISGTADAIKTYGRAKETAYQLGKALKEIKRDYERAMVGVENGATAPSDNSAGRVMASVPSMITTNIDANATSGGVADGGGGTEGTASAVLVESDVIDLGQLCYENGSEPSLLMVKPADARKVAGFARTSSGQTRTLNDNNKTLVNAIDLLVTPYGEYRVVINRHMKSDHALLIDPSMFKTCTLRPFTRTLLAKTGDNDRHLIVGEVSVKHNSFEDSGKIVDLA